MASQQQLERAVISAANAAGFARYTMGALHEYDGANGDVGLGVMLTVFYDERSITTLIKPLMAFLGLANAPPTGIRALVGSIIIDGTYVILVRASDDTAHIFTQAVVTTVEPQPIVATQSKRNGHIKLTWERIQTMLPKVEKWLATDAARSQLIHSDEEISDFEWDADGQTQSPDDACIKVYTYSKSHHHRTTYDLYFNTNYEPDTMSVSLSSDECRGCAHERNEDERLWHGPGI
jgi:hypothetical protein